MANQNGSTDQIDLEEEIKPLSRLDTSSHTKEKSNLLISHRNESKLKLKNVNLYRFKNLPSEDINEIL